MKEMVVVLVLTSMLTTVLGYQYNYPSCSDKPSNWIADNYFTCDNIKLNSWCSTYGSSEIGTDRKTANQACCACGGGNTASPTPSPDPA